MNSKYYPEHWSWILSANFGEGLPYAIVNTLMVALLADMGMNNGSVAAITGLLSLPWALKAFWSPLIESYSSKRRWMVCMQLGLGIVFLITGLCLQFSFWQTIVVICAIIAAILSATYDISCDGFYMIALPRDAQAFFVGIRSTAYKLGWLIATGGLVWIAGKFAHSGMSVITSWQITFGIIAVIMFGLCILHNFILPRADDSAKVSNILSGYKESVKTFFTSKSIGDIIFLLLFIFTYRLGEALLSKVTILFLKDKVENGGIGLDNEQYGLLYGTIGVLALTLGGILGGFYISKFSLRRSIILMALALNIPDILYVYLSLTQPSSLPLIGSCVAVEQFGYGFGFTAYTVYLLQCAKGQFETAHYAFLTALMALGMTIPTMLSGYWQQSLGYPEFFIRACWLTLPGILMSVWYVFRYKNNH